MAVIKCENIASGKCIKIGNLLIVGAKEENKEPNIAGCPYTCCK